MARRPLPRVGGKVAQQVQLLEIVVDIERQYLRRGAVVVGCEDQPEQALDDECIAVHGQLQPAVLHGRVDPHLALATAYQAVFGMQFRRHGRQLPPQLDDVLVAIFPAVEKAQGVENILGFDAVAEGIVRRGCPRHQ